MQLFHLSERSENVKTGPIATSYSSMNTCPKSCALYNKCYGYVTAAKYHWYKVSDGRNGFPFAHFIKRVKALPKGSSFRINVCGDLPGVNLSINGRMLNSLINATNHLTRWTYTHKPVIGRSPIARSNRALIKFANQRGFAVNLSADNLTMADKYLKMGIAPVVSIVRHDAPERGFTPKGTRYITCPAQTRETMTCARCRLCAFKDRKYIIAFRAHAQNKGRIEELTGNT